MSNKTVKDSEAVINGECRFTGKVAYRKNVAVRRAASWKPDDRGSWSAYQCRFSPEHWHVGHTPSLETINEDNPS